MDAGQNLTVDKLSFFAAVLHGMACVVTIVFAIARRRMPDRQDARLLAMTWCLWLGESFASDLVVRALPPPSQIALSSIHDRVLLALDGALYFAWPLGMAAWIRWTFVRAKWWPFFVAWLLAFGIPTAVYPAIRGVSWFYLAGAVHLAAFASEIIAIVQWAKRREKPQPWHGIGLVASWVSTMPAISFFVLPESQESYGNWVLRALIALHLWVLAMVGGAKWRS